MSESELSKALLRLDIQSLSGAIDARLEAWKVLERDRRRVRWLTVITVAIWLLAGALVFTGMVSYGLIMPAQAKLFQDAKVGRLDAAQREAAQRDLVVSFMMTNVLVCFSVGVATVAALSTVVLIFASRRATLRQVNTSLVEIAAQLKRLSPAPGGA
jgi:hypothetical protein